MLTAESGNGKRKAEIGNGRQQYQECAMMGIRVSRLVHQYGWREREVGLLLVSFVIVCFDCCCMRIVPLLAL